MFGPHILTAHFFLQSLTILQSAGACGSSMQMKHHVCASLHATSVQKLFLSKASLMRTALAQSVACIHMYSVYIIKYQINTGGGCPCTHDSRGALMTRGSFGAVQLAAARPSRRSIFVYIRPLSAKNIDCVLGIRIPVATRQLSKRTGHHLMRLLLLT